MRYSVAPCAYVAPCSIHVVRYGRNRTLQRNLDYVSGIRHSGTKFVLRCHELPKTSTIRNINSITKMAFNETCVFTSCTMWLSSIIRIKYLLNIKIINTYNNQQIVMQSRSVLNIDFSRGNDIFNNLQKTIRN